MRRLALILTAGAIALAALAAMPAGAAADAAAARTACQEAIEAAKKPSTTEPGGWVVEYGWQPSCGSLTCREAVEVAHRTGLFSSEMSDWEGRGPCPQQSDVEGAEHEIWLVEDAAARAKALSEPLNRLVVKVVSYPARCRQACDGALLRPGYTILDIGAAPYVYLTVQIVRYGHRTEHFELDGDHAAYTSIPWTCSRPGGVYHYTVSAHSNVGETLVRRGTFRSVTAARCHWLKHAVQVAREHDERQAREGEREGEREERERLKRWESNCRALGDTPAVLNEEGGVLHVCRTPGGYTIEVPE